MNARIALISLVFSGTTLAQEKGVPDQSLPPIAEGHRPGVPARPPLVEACLVEGCNGVEVLNKAPIPVVVQAAQRVPFHHTFSEALVFDGGTFGACGRLSLAAHPLRIEHVSAQVYTDQAVTSAVATLRQVDDRGSLMNHAFAVTRAGYLGALIGSAPTALWLQGGQLVACVGESPREGTMYLHVSGYYEVPAGARPPVD
jgi:hypothetical protein